MVRYSKDLGDIRIIYLDEIWEGELPELGMPGLYAKGEQSCLDIIRHYQKKSTFFFDFFREDLTVGGYNTLNLFREMVPNYIRTHGEYYFEPWNKGKKFDSRFRSAARLPADENTYKAIPYFFCYFMDSILFCPADNLTWEKYICHFKKHPLERAEQYIANRFCDMAFLLTDSADFSILFNSNHYNVEEEEKTVSSYTQHLED